MKKDINTFITIIKQLYYILDSKQRKWSMLVLTCIILGAVLELLGASAIIPFIYALMEPQAIKNNEYARVLFDAFHIESTEQVVLAVSIGIIVIYIVKNGFLLLSAYVQAWYKSYVQKSLSTLVLQSFLKRPYLDAANLNCAEVRRWIYSDTDGVYNTITSMCRLCSAFLTISALGVFIIITDPIMAVSMIGVGGFCSLLLTLNIKAKMREAGYQQREADTYRDKYVNQSVYGVKEVHVMGKQNFFIQRYWDASEMKRKADCLHSFIEACPERIIEVIFIVALVIIICFRAWSGWDIKEFIPQLGAFAVAAFKVLPLFAQISSNISALVFYRLAVEETYDNVKFYRNRQKEIVEINSENNDSIIKNGMKQELKIENVEWSYGNDLPTVIKNANISIQKGESIGLIGPSGAGKSTLSDIILGLLQPPAGSVTVDGIDIFSIREQWSHIVGYVPQSIYLIDDTIKANIAFGQDEQDIDEQKVWETLNMAKLDNFVKTLEHGIETVIGERGIRLSGGQRQRIAIARALYFAPDIIVFDEATSALDNETENAVMESISDLQGKKTLIIVAHRLSTIQNCDKIYEVNEGDVIRKNHEEIFGKNHG